MYYYLWNGTGAITHLSFRMSRVTDLLGNIAVRLLSRKAEGVYIMRLERWVLLFTV